MIIIEKTDVYGWEAAIRGLRNPMNSWEKSDSTAYSFDQYGRYTGIGPNDRTLMFVLAEGGPVNAKYRRMITVTCDITAPLYWWKEFDTYKVGTVANSCSTMHTIHKKPFELDDFSHDHLDGFDLERLKKIIEWLNDDREAFLETADKQQWYGMIQLLPTSYNQRRTVLTNYEVLSNIYRYRRDHRLNEWRELCRWIEKLPYSEIITLREGEHGTESDSRRT